MNITSWPTKQHLPKRLMSIKWDDLPWVLMSFCVNMGFHWRSYFPWVWDRYYGSWALIHCLSLIHILMLMMSWFMNPIDEEEMSIMNSPLEVKILWAMWAQSLELNKIWAFWVLKEIYPKSMIMLTWHGLPMKWCHVAWKKSPQHIFTLSWWIFVFFKSQLSNRVIFFMCWHILWQNALYLYLDNSKWILEYHEVHWRLHMQVRVVTRPL